MRSHRLVVLVGLLMAAPGAAPGQGCKFDVTGVRTRLLSSLLQDGAARATAVADLDAGGAVDVVVGDLAGMAVLRGDGHGWFVEADWHVTRGALGL